MKNLLITTSFFITTQAFAQVYFESMEDAVIRTSNYKAKIEKVLLTDLTNEDCFEGKFFKIVKGKDDSPICFHNSDKNLKLKAATVYYHLTKARHFFASTIDSTYVKQSGQLTIRVDITQQFNSLGHFGNDNIEAEYNNALSIPSGNGYAPRGIKPWSNEIWFRPPKAVHFSEIMQNPDANEFQVIMQSFRSQTHMTTIQRFISSLVQGQSPSKEATSYDWINFGIRTAGTSVIMEAAYQASASIAKLLSRKWYHLDTALVPEIIYHEYAHIALNDRLELSHSTPVIEGMADYFAATIANSPELAKKIKKYNTFNGKEAKNKKKFMIQFETTDFANSDFVLGLLWDLKNVLGDKLATEFVYSLSNKINTNSTIRKDLIEGILTTCEEKCPNPFIDKISILQKLHLRGI